MAPWVNTTLNNFYVMQRGLLLTYSHFEPPQLQLSSAADPNASMPKRVPNVALLSFWSSAACISRSFATGKGERQSKSVEQGARMGASGCWVSQGYAWAALYKWFIINSALCASFLCRDLGSAQAAHCTAGKDMEQGNGRRGTREANYGLMQCNSIC